MSKNLHRFLTFWLEELMCYESSPLVYRTQQPDSGLETYEVFVFAGPYYFHITAEDDYLGCIASERPPKFAGNDLPDGPMTRETWDAIKQAMFAYLVDDPSGTEVSHIEKLLARGDLPFVKMEPVPK